MYSIKKNGILISLEEKLNTVKKNRNNIYVPCERAEAEGVVIDNAYIEPITELDIKQFDGANQINRMNAAGAEAMQSLNAEPPKSAGAFTYAEWTPGKVYKRFENFTLKGVAGFARQEHTAQEHYRPFTEGMSAIYGARPPRDADGVYSYVSSMKVEVGDKVRSEKDGEVYICYANGADPLTYDPADVPALFELFIGDE